MLLLAPVVVGAALPGAERRLAPSADECTVPVPGGSRGTFVRSLTECTERYSSEVLCNGYNLVLTRVDRKGLDFWDVLVRIKNSSADAGSAPQTAIDGLEMSQVSHNAAYFCSSEGKLIMYGGRIRPHDTFRGDPADGHYPGLLRYEGDVSASGVKWSDPLLLLDEAKARSLNCTDARRNHEGLCEFDGKLSVAEFKGSIFVFGRLNPGQHDYRHVQMTSSPIGKPTELEPFRALEFADYERTQDNNIYFMSIEAREDALVGLFPAVIDGRGGIYYSESTDGLHWLKPQLLMESNIFGPRTDDYPVDGFVASASGGLSFAVDHGIVLEHGKEVDAAASQSGACTPPHTCRYELSAKALKRLVATDSSSR